VVSTLTVVHPMKEADLTDAERRNLAEDEY
jgi:hypothetical protein